jgi:MerR family mercuric resistance operon transcriptional regulator
VAKSAAKSEFPIGALAKESAVNIETIRYYEKIGLMPKPARSVGGYRLYTPTVAARFPTVR